MRILLVKPKSRLRTIIALEGFQILEPLELGYLAAAVPAGHEVRVLDLRLERFAERAFLRALARFRPDLVGFTAYSHEGSIVKRFARAVRAVLPQARIVIGGHHATVAPDDLAVDAVDAVVRGEGCAPFRAIVEALAAGRDLTGIPQVLVRGADFSAADEAWPQFPNPSTLPIPRRDLWDPRSYRAIWLSGSHSNWQPLYRTVSLVRTSWGCRMKCSFCVVPFLCGGRHQPRPIESVVDEIAALPADHVYFCDDENFIDEQFAGDLAEALARRGVRKRYYAWTRATTVNRSPELLRRWGELGLDAAFLGFEFPTDEELKRSHKGGTVAGNERALDRLRGMGIAVHAAFMVQPEHSEENFERLRRYVCDLPPAECSVTVCTPSPGTPSYAAIKPRIWVDNPFDFHDCMHPLTPTALPLWRFAALFAAQVVEGVARTPRGERRPAPPLELLRVWRAQWRWQRAFRALYRDYPHELWGL